MTPPRDPVAAVTHPDPYPYYADLVARRPLFRDEALGLWVASSAGAVTAVLTSDRCRVRPPSEPVPAAIVGSPSGAIFGHLVRMNDGARHAPLKGAVTAALDALAPSRIAALSRACARTLADEMAPEADPRRLTEFTFRLAPSVVGALLGAPPSAAPALARWTREFVGGIAPGASADARDRGEAAAAHLWELGRTLTSGNGLVAELAGHARGQAHGAVIANALGFLSQSYDATAGLIGNTLVALARRPERRQADLLLRLVVEVARHDPPIQNTRRFVAEDGVVAGQAMKAGDVILVVLAAANRDPAANPDPERFDVDRGTPCLFTFGLGPHACPGATLATTIAAAGVEQLLATDLPLDALAERVTYHTSVNARVPLFGKEPVP